ncbi:MAG: beta-propeller domain-containing protein, partial [Clostridia bacterium]|nr:beta-propeller domain-containing protein [Clostridia bacterium]
TTEICRIDYSSGELKRVGSVFLEGHVNDQYSLDVYDGVLRVFTSIGNVDSKFEDTEYGHHVYDISNNVVNASLYCVDINTFEVIASVDKFAPDGENVKSARFDKDIAYVCTSVQLTDPVFMFDLSDLGNITYKDTGTIEGFSSSLVDFADGYLLGIGIKDWGNPKIEIYKEDGDKVVSVSAVELTNSDISGVYKSYYIDRQRGYIGLGVYKYGNDEGCVYIILKFENDKLRVVGESVLENHRNTSTIRGTLIDGFFYILSEENMTVISEDSLA